MRYRRATARAGGLKPAAAEGFTHPADLPPRI